MPRIRPEQPADIPAIDEVLTAAFPTREEADLVKTLRKRGDLTISLVAEEDGVVIGCIAFSPVTVNGNGGGLGLAPVAVVPDQQSMGYGAALVREGLERARQMNVPYVVVLGHSHYYPQFGFKRAKPLGFTNEYEADDAFMILELQPGKLPNGGLVKYGAEFAAWS